MVTIWIERDRREVSCSGVDQMSSGHELTVEAIVEDDVPFACAERLDNELCVIPARCRRPNNVAAFRAGTE